MGWGKDEGRGGVGGSGQVEMRRDRWRWGVVGEGTGGDRKERVGRDRSGHRGDRRFVSPASNS